MGLRPESKRETINFRCDASFIEEINKWADGDHIYENFSEALRGLALKGAKQFHNEVEVGCLETDSFLNDKIIQMFRELNEKPNDSKLEKKIELLKELSKFEKQSCSSAKHMDDFEVIRLLRDLFKQAVTRGLISDFDREGNIERSFVHSEQFKIDEKIKIPQELLNQQKNMQEKFDFSVLEEIENEIINQ